MWGGRFVRTAQKRGYNAFGIDVSSKAIRYAIHGQENLKLIVGDGEELPIKNGMFDCVTCLGSLEHFLHPERTVREIVRVLKNGGVAIFMVPNLFFIGHIYLVYKYGRIPYYGDQPFEKLRTIEEWKELLHSAGLNIIKIKKHNQVMYTTRVSNIIRIFYDYLFSFLVPRNLSIRLIFICKKER